MTTYGISRLFTITVLIPFKVASWLIIIVLLNHILNQQIICDYYVFNMFGRSSSSMIIEFQLIHDRSISLAVFWRWHIFCNQFEDVIYIQFKRVVLLNIAVLVWVGCCVVVELMEQYSSPVFSLSTFSLSCLSHTICLFLFTSPSNFGQPECGCSQMHLVNNNTTQDRNTRKVKKKANFNRTIQNMFTFSVETLFSSNRLDR